MKKNYTYKGMSKQAQDTWVKKHMAESEPATARATKDDDEETIKFRQEARASEMQKMEKIYAAKVKGLDACVCVNGTRFEKGQKVTVDYNGLTPYQQRKYETFESLGILHAG